MINQQRSGRSGRVTRLSRRSLLRAAAATAALATASACASRKASNGQTAPAQSGSAAGGTPKPGGVLNVALAANTLLDPHLLSAGVSVMSAALSRPFRIKSGVDPQVGLNLELESDLAVSAESPDGLTWTVKLRPGARFQDLPPVNGHPVEAEDVKQTFIRATTYVKNPNRGSIGMIDPEQIQAPAADTLTFRLKYPYGPFPKILAASYSWILPREAVAGAYDPESLLIGSGPFVLQSHTPDVGFKFSKNPSWFETGRPYVDGVNVAIIPDPAQQLAQFSTGHLDELQVMSNDLETATANNKSATVIKLPTQGNPNIYFQLGDPASFFLDARARRAISMSLDRDAMGKILFGGRYERYVFVPLTQGRWAMKVDALPADLAANFSYNLAEAKKLLAAAGLGGQEFKMAYVSDGGVSGGTANSRGAQVEAFHSMLEALGLKTSLVPLNSQKDYIDSGKGYRQGYYPKDTLMQGASAEYTDIDEYLFSYFHSKSTSNEDRLSDPALDAQIDKARTLLDEDERLKASLDIQKYLADKIYIVPSVSSYNFTLLQPAVHNYAVSSTTNRLFGETYSKVWLQQ
jgi:peptide/nickel transport system substrate-binding protein